MRSNIEILTWADMKIKYPEYREELSEEEEKQFVADCFKLYEKEKTAKVFWSQGGDYKQYIGKVFKVVKRCDTSDTDLCCLPMWVIEFEDKKQIAAYPDEIVIREMKENGCRLLLE